MTPTSNNNNNNNNVQSEESIDRLLALIDENPDNVAKHAHVLRVLTSLRLFSEDGGASAEAMSSFDIVQQEMVNIILESWVAARPMPGGRLYGYEAVERYDGRVMILAPNGSVYYIY